MNAACLLMSAAWMAGADTASHPLPAGAPAVINTGSGCSNCGPVASAYCDDPCAKTGILAKLKSKVGGLGKKGGDCGYAPAPAPACDACASSRPNLLDTVKGRFGKKKGGDCCAPACAPACDPCGAAPAVVVHPPAGAITPPPPPKDMPKGKDADPKPKEPEPKPKTTAPGATGLPAIPTPLTPVTTPQLNGTTSPY